MCSFSSAPLPSHIGVVFHSSISNKYSLTFALSYLESSNIPNILQTIIRTTWAGWVGALLLLLRRSILCLSITAGTITSADGGVALPSDIAPPSPLRHMNILCIIISYNYNNDYNNYRLILDNNDNNHNSIHEDCPSLPLAPHEHCIIT